MSFYMYSSFFRHVFLFFQLYLQYLSTLFYDYFRLVIDYFFLKSIFSLNKSNLKNNTINKKRRLNAKKHG
jgi:hypothetical protein